MEKERFKRLLDHANIWHQAKIVREFIDAFAQNASGKSYAQDKLEEWIDWAKKKVDGYNPLVMLKDETLFCNNRLEI
jgi:hypothetical protein